MSNRLIFHLYSSRNKKGGLPHPVVFRRKDRALTLWWQHRTKEEIAAELDISVDTVRRYIDQARRLGDPRAMAKRTDRRIMAAAVRRRTILDLSARGMSIAEIASVLRCHVRLVQMRIREAAHV